MLRFTWSAPITLLVLLALPARGSASNDPPFASFTQLDNIEAEFTLLGAYPIRPMAADPATLDLFTVNVGLSTVLHFRSQDLPAGNPFQTWQVPAQPVSIGIWNDTASSIPGSVRKLVVVCRGVHAAVLLDSVTGQVLRLLRLDHEPGDLLIDQARGRAFVSCQGKRTVVEIDLATFARANTIALVQQEPLRMCFDDQMRVLVAPLCSGNNSSLAAGPPGNPSVRSVADLDPFFPTVSVPDEDLVQIDPFTTPPTVTTVANRRGTLLFAHGFNPVPPTPLGPKEHWQLTVEALNKFGPQSEPALNGAFAKNSLTIATLPSLTAPFPAAIELDTRSPLPNGNPDPARTVSLPIDLQFDPAGRGYIVGLATDNVMVLDSSGNFVSEWNLPDRSGPRAALLVPVSLSPFDRMLFVYLAHTNKIRCFLFTSTSNLPASASDLDLGFDPAPVAVKEGRQIFFDASFSRDNRLTCAHCHVEGKSDLIAWNLSNQPKDDKGPLVTQTLFGIQRMPPFHWRGERPALADFNPAFTALLGGPRELSDGELASFEAFVFALTPAANPNEHVTRHVFGNSAIAGQTLYNTSPVLFGFSCVQCHDFPTGSNSDIVNTEVLARIPQQNRFDVAHFLELWRKESQSVTLTLNGVQETIGRLGFGLAHNGRNADLLDFIVDSFALSDLESFQIREFVNQWDQGIAPAAHRAALLDSSLQDEPEVLFLKDQAVARNCDLAVIAVSHYGGVITRRNYAFDPVNQVFASEDPAEASMPYSILRILATSGYGNLTFVGLPPGNAPMWIDWDRDALFNHHELTIPNSVPADRFKRDSDGDGDPDGHEVFNFGDARSSQFQSNDTSVPVIQSTQVVWVTTRVARLLVRTNEPTICDVVVQGPTGSRSFSTAEYALVHNVLLTGLDPSPVGGPLTNHTVAITVSDPKPNTSPATNLSLQPERQRTVNPSVESQLVDVQWLTTPSRTGSSATGQVEFTVVTKESVTQSPSAPTALPGQLIVARVLDVPLVGGREDLLNATVLSPQTTATSGGPQIAVSFSFADPNPLSPPNTFLPYGNPGSGEQAPPFLITAPTDAQGKASVFFTVQGVSSGHKLVVAVLGVLPHDVNGTFTPSAPRVGTRGTSIPLQNAPFLPFSFADTPGPKREIGQVLN